jgi:ABC-type nitrate/sulfonate/bicarbonate transport system permease component
MIDNFNRYVLANADLLGQGLLVTLRVCVQAFLLAIVLAIAVSLLRPRWRWDPRWTPQDPRKAASM